MSLRKRLEVSPIHRNRMRLAPPDLCLFPQSRNITENGSGDNVSNNNNPCSVINGGRVSAQETSMAQWSVQTSRSRLRRSGFYDLFSHV